MGDFLGKVIVLVLGKPVAIARLDQRPSGRLAQPMQ